MNTGSGFGEGVEAGGSKCGRGFNWVFGILAGCRLQIWGTERHIERPSLDSKRYIDMTCHIVMRSAL